ncbi:MAG: DUF302 domain-containing protein [Rhodospirillaceae bacterium]|nr:DUF302 domain-containing protein [Rhodospirillaceae bacterium]
MNRSRAFAGFAALVFALALIAAWLSGSVRADVYGDGVTTRYIIIERPVLLEDDGIVGMISAFTVDQTIERLRTLIGLKGLAVYAQIDHAAEAAKAGRTMPPMELILFGGPSLGAALVPDAPSLGIDLPFAMLVYRNDEGRTILAYEDADWLARRHAIREDNSEIRRAGDILEELARTATGAP